MSTTDKTPEQGLEQLIGEADKLQTNDKFTKATFGIKVECELILNGKHTLSEAPHEVKLEWKIIMNVSFENKISKESKKQL
ncbi:MAG: hypothetical protein FK734_07950 [Asgard group archaeon]|nr:hypothetical protein [Asgard group archaeon]